MAATDLLSTTEARTAINITTSAKDTDLALFVAGISDRIDALCGPVVARTVTSEQHNGGKSYIVPRKAPVYSVTSVTEYDAGSAQVLTAETVSSRVANNYLLDTSIRLYPRIWRRESGSDATFPSDRLNVVITYSAGRVADTASVEEKFKLTATAILKRLWKRETSAWARSATGFTAEDAEGASRFYRAVDPMVQELLADELLPPVVR